MKNKLVFDIGNSHIVIGFYQNNIQKASWRISTDRTRTEDEYFVLIRQLLSQENIDLIQISHSALSSVVPQLTRVFDHMLKKYFNCRLLIINPYLELGLKFSISDPGFIGADLIVNAFAAKEKYHTNCIICDFGTATTLQLVGKDGFFYGTIIAPGILTSSENLFNKASLLSNIKLEKPSGLLGTNTKDALLTGIIDGNAIMIDEFIKRIRNKYSDLGKIKAIATGGIANLICEQTRQIDHIDKELTLDGLSLILDRTEIDDQT